MKYAMLSTLIPDEYNQIFSMHSKHNMQEAANVLQWNLYKGFCENMGDDILLFNVLPVGSFPQYYNLPFISKFNFGNKGVNIGFCNVKVLRNYFKYRNIYKALYEWCCSGPESKTLFVYTISKTFISVVSKLKKQFRNLTVCAIVADLPDMSNLSMNKTFLQTIYVRWQNKYIYGNLFRVDAFVLLTEKMADYLQISQPFCVMEGIASEEKRNDNYIIENPLIDKNYKIVFYSGTLHQKFGILHLVEAFKRIPDDSFRLVLCGIGDSEKAIQHHAEEDNRICVLGKIPRMEVLKWQKNATVLVNPRLNSEEYTKYSFPSKTMEYLMSETPVIAYKLDGIPDEYDLHIRYPDDNSTTCLANTIYELCMLPAEVRRRMGRDAKEFVSKNKNAKVQCKRILEFLSNILEE